MEFGLLCQGLVQSGMGGRGVQQPAPFFILRHTLGFLKDRFPLPFLLRGLPPIPAVYLTASFAAACAPTYVFFLGTMFAMGVGIGGEYSSQARPRGCSPDEATFCPEKLSFWKLLEGPAFL